MANRQPSAIISLMAGCAALLAAAAVSLDAEIIPVSKIRKEKKEFTMSRDIFSPFKQKTVISSREDAIAPPPPPVEEKTEEPAEKPNPADEVKRNLIYEGYVLGAERGLAVLTYNGESFFLGENELIFDRIKIVKIEQLSVVVEVDGFVVEINIKGDSENGALQPQPQPQQVQYEEEGE